MKWELYVLNNSLNSQECRCEEKNAHLEYLQVSLEKNRGRNAREKTEEREKLREKGKINAKGARKA
jgi:hypothetical protein